MLTALVVIGIGLLPPAKFDYPPRTYLKVIEGPAHKVNRFCKKASRYNGQRSALACTLPGKGICIIVWPQGKPRSGGLWRHERAHCNGWKHG